MSIHIGSEVGEIGTCDSDAVRDKDLRVWLGRAIIDDARNEFRMECLGREEADPRDEPGANPDDGGVEDMEALADAEAQRFQDKGEWVSGAAMGGRYF